MERNYKERLVYTIEKLESGKETFIGKCVNYPSIIIQANSEDELKHEAKISIKFWFEHCEEQINQEDPFQLEFIENQYEWLWNKECNIDYWELERFKYLINKRPEFLKQVKEILNNY